MYCSTFKKMTEKNKDFVDNKKRTCNSSVNSPINEKSLDLILPHFLVKDVDAFDKDFDFLDEVAGSQSLAQTTLPLDEVNEMDSFTYNNSPNVFSINWDIKNKDKAFQNYSSSYGTYPSPQESKKMNFQIGNKNMKDNHNIWDNSGIIFIKFCYRYHTK